MASAIPETQPARPASARAVDAPGIFDFERRASERSSRLADLVRSGDAFDLEAIGAFLLARLPLDRSATPWRGIRAVPRRRRIDVDEQQDVSREEVIDAAAAVEGLRAELESAVARCLEGSRCVAVMTGGGVDSSGLLGLAVDWAKRTGRTAFAVSLDFDGGAGDDRPYLRALEAFLGCDVLRVRPEDAAPHFASVRQGIDAAPFVWPGAAMELELFSRAKQAGADRILTGAGGDLLFDGSPFALARHLRKGRFGEAVIAARAMTGFYAMPRSRVFSFAVRPLLARLVPVRIRRARMLRRVLVPDWAGERLRRIMVEYHRADVDDALRSRDTAERRLAAVEAAPALARDAWYQHQHETATGLVRFDPYLDASLVRFVARLSPELLVRGAVRRGLFRDAIRGLVPESLRMRLTKAGFEDGFTRSVAAAGGFEQFRDLARASALADAGFVEPREFMAAFHELASQPIDSWGWGDVWPALAVESFMRSRGGQAA